MFQGSPHSTKQIWMNQQKGNNSADKYLAIADMLQTEGEDREYDINTRKLSFINGSIQVGLSDRDYSSQFQVTADTENATSVIKTKSGSNAQLILDINPALAAGNGFKNGLISYKKDGSTLWMLGLNSDTGGSDDEFVLANGDSFDTDSLMNVTRTDGLFGFGKKLPTAKGHFKSAGTLGTDSILILENGDTVNNKMFDFLANGEVEASLINIYAGLRSYNRNTSNPERNVLIGGSSRIGAVNGSYNSAIAIGYGAFSDKEGAIAIGGQTSGFGPRALGTSSIAIGQATAGDLLSIHIGNGGYSRGPRSINIGKDNTHDSGNYWGVSIGQSIVNNLREGNAIGSDHSLTSGSYSSTFGNNNIIAGSNNHLFGFKLNDGGFDDIVMLGTGSTSTGNYVEATANKQFIVGITRDGNKQIQWEVNGICYTEFGVSTQYVWGAKTPIGSENFSFQGDILMNAKVLMTNLPTSATGLNTGELWNDSGTLKIA